MILPFVAQASVPLAFCARWIIPHLNAFLWVLRTLRFMEYYELDPRSSVHFRTYAPFPSSRAEEHIAFLLFSSIRSNI